MELSLSGALAPPFSKKSTWKWLPLDCSHCRSLQNFSEAVIEIDAGLPINF